MVADDDDELVVVRAEIMSSADITEAWQFSLRGVDEVQIVEAAVRQYAAWPQGSEEGALVLAGAARFLAAHTPTRRELPHVVRTAVRLRRGDDLFEES